jgi:hypothetical protein
MDSSATFRQAKLSDLNALVAFAVPMVLHDGFHDYFFPGQDEFPEDMFDW